MNYLGDFAQDKTIYIYFTTHAASGAAVAPSSAFEAEDVRIYKNGSDAQKTTANGLTMVSPFDALTGLHKLEIDTSVDTGDAGFWVGQADYSVGLSPDETVDSLAVIKVIATFSIENRSALRPATAGRTVVVDPNGLADANTVKLGPTGAGTAQTARDVGLNVDAATSTRSSHTADNVRDSVLNRVLAGNHDAAGSAGKLIQAITEARLAELDGANIPADIDALILRLTATRAAFLDKLNISGNVASSSEVTSIQNNTRVVRVVPEVIERPDFIQAYRVELLLYDAVGNMEVPDSAPTIELVDQGGTDRSIRLDSTTMALVETGRYRAIYTCSAGDNVPEQLVWSFTVIEGGVTRKYGNTMVVVDTTAVDFTSADRTKLDTLHDTRIPGVIQPQTGDVFARVGANGAGLTALPWNAAWDAEVESEVADALAAFGKTGYSLSASGLDLVLIEAAIVASAALTNDSGAQLTSINIKQAMAVVLSMAAAVVSGAEGFNMLFRPAAKPVATPRIDATVTALNNRTAVSLKVPD